MKNTTRIILGLVCIAICVVLFLAFPTYSKKPEAYGGSMHVLELDETGGENTLVKRIARAQFRIMNADTYDFPKETIAYYVEKLGAFETIALLSEVTDGLCHYASHAIGEITYEKTKSVATAEKLCGDVCYSGCIHGAVIGALKEAGVELFDNNEISFFELADYAKKVCESEITGACFHAVGHTLFSYVYPNIEEPLEACAHYENKGIQHYCATGVFMEVAEQGDMVTGDPRNMYPCDNAGIFSAACYRYKVESLAEDLGGVHDVSELKNICNSLEGSARRGCYNGLGKFFIPTIRDNMPFINEVCSSDHSEDEHICVQGAIEMDAYYDEERALRICEVLTTEELKETCRASAQAENKHFNMEKSFEPYF